MHYFRPELLERLAHSVGLALGCIDDEAREMASHLVGANLAGHDSHGIGMIPDYVRVASQRLMVPNQTLETVVDFGALMILDGRRGLGQWMAKMAMDRAIERANQTGSCTLGLRNSAHVGRIGHYAEQCARAGMASVHFVNVSDHAPLQAPFGCADSRLGTNPIAMGIPGPDGPALILDMATSKIAFGKARVARNKGVPVPEGSLLDEDGSPTTDPNLYVDTKRGALTAFGEHKGSGLAIFSELFGAALTGGVTIHPGHERKDGIVNSMLSIVIDASKLKQATNLDDEVEAVKDYIRQSRIAPGFDEILLPGEPEQRSRADRQTQGIPLDAKSVDDILAAARMAGAESDIIGEVEAARS